ncbi:OmpP1/FadL family transporter [Sediminitomix flava]|uniref:Long-subunit fatty acid transport protein n=1 Tax=Sediminitomix flava TaxID=379075 RepID=A0A315YWX0_SEDFL|nr:outer membrane protein transport protein [Sediminitomix flava]PWJ34143.1 long-subunit fatty acid transport protein [Sediminitomix flava]
MLKQLSYVSLFLCLLFAREGAAQIGNSPYTTLGYGRSFEPMSIRNIAMGGVGVSLGHPGMANTLNPALLTYNRLTLFEAGYFVEGKWLDQKTESGNTRRETEFNGNFTYLHFAVPVSKKLSMSASLRPASSLNYRFSNLSPVESGSGNGGVPSELFYLTENSGKGGITQASLAAGYSIIKGLSIGIDASYNFGVQEDRFSSVIVTSGGGSVIDGGRSEYEAVQLARLNQTGWSFQPGIYYAYDFGGNPEQNRPNNRRISIGATYQFEAPLKQEGDIITSLQNQSGITIGTADTIPYPSSADLEIPSRYTVGVSYEIIGKLALAFDYSRQNFDKFVYPLDPSQQYRDSQRFSAGMEYTPDILSATNYWKRITWRAGLRYEELPNQIEFEGNTETLTDVSLNGGFSMPIGFSNVTLTGTWGRIKPSNDRLVTENYWRVYLALTINDQWFRRIRVN